MTGLKNQRLALIQGALLLAVAGSLDAEAGKPVDYGRDIRPILSENCFHCHGQDASKRMAGLRLDTPEGAHEKRNGRAAIVAGKPEESTLYLRISSANKAMKMPPAHSNRTLSQEQIALLKRWISEGGEYAKHWAFIPPRLPAVPQVENRAWVKQPIDAFILNRLEAEKLTPRSPAAPAAWLRRVFLDLTGLPPTPEQSDEFVRNVEARGEAAYAAAVDRLLDSPRYGERMAMEWLDVARYADTHGFNNDSTRSMWRWRDWVIDSFNSNMPYNQFLTEQLAGDLLPSPSLNQKIATGFGRNHVINSEGGIIDEEYRVEYVADRVRTLGMAWMGLTLECARCHDHKYDPISQKDHYRFYAFFNNVPEAGEDGRISNAIPMIAAPTADQQTKLKELSASVAALEKKLLDRERSWRWRNNARITPPSPVEGATLRLSCDSGSHPGIAGSACAVAGKEESEPVMISRRQPLTFSMWLNPAEGDREAAILSAANYGVSKAATTYGAGIDVRLVNGEVEFRFGQRFPAYSMRVRSEGAAIGAGKWTHAALVYEGVTDVDDGYGRAAWLRMFVNGREVPTRVLNDGMAIVEKKSDKPVSTRFRIGWDNGPGSPRYAGRYDEIEVWNRALTGAEVLQAFESRALPYARNKARENAASNEERAWLRLPLLRAADSRYAAVWTEWTDQRARQFALQRQSPTVMVMQEMNPPRETHVLLRGAYNAPGDKVEPGAPEDLLGAWPAGAPRNRLGLAQWLTKADHPLTARVVVNRFWQQIFGQGIVKTSDNFGLQGEFPSHPELLDFLARSFVDSGWNVKALMRQIVLSSTYRQDSAAPSELIARDPENRLLARGPRFRLSAETIRDHALAVSGLLTQRIGGPSVFPYQPADLYKGIVVAAVYPGTSWEESKGADLYRRSMYTFWKRTVPHPTMTVFDAPDREVCVVRRSTTNTPLQALTLMNDPIFVEAARQLASRVVREQRDLASRLALAFRLAAGRQPDAAELAVLTGTFEKALAGYRQDAASARALLQVGKAPIESSIPAEELAAYTAVTNMILNLDEVITKG